MRVALDHDLPPGGGRRLLLELVKLRRITFARIGLATRRWAVALLLASAFAVRLLNLGHAPVDFHPVRQFHSFLLARAIYIERLGAAPTLIRHAAAVAAAREPRNELPINENIAALAYQFMGGEQVWFPRVLSAATWCVGGVFLYLLVRRLAGRPGALAAMAVYLFMPFGITASRSFQPDPLMVAVYLLSILALVASIEAPGRRRFAAAAACAALTSLVKPQAALLLMPIFLSLVVYKWESRRLGWAVPGLVYAAALALPAVTPILAGTPSDTFFLAGILSSGTFWGGWLEQANSVVGLGALVAGLAGTIWLARGQTRVLLLGMWAGYAQLAVVFDYRVATHSYYSLPLVPIVAVAVGVLIAGRPGRARRLVAALMIADAIAVGIVAYRTQMEPFTSADLGAARVSAYREVGAGLRHADNTLILAPEMSRAVEYYGELAGVEWPSLDELKLLRLSGQPGLTPHERLTAYLNSEHVRWFIVADAVEFDSQPGLRDELESHYSVAARGDKFLVYDLAVRH